MASYKPPKAPEFKSYDLSKMQYLGGKYDRVAYRQSDTDFARRHKPLLQAEKLFEAQTLKDQKGDSELMPSVQNEFMRAGLAKSLGAFGDSAGTLTPGSAGEANVARNFGLSTIDFQDRNRTNRERSLIVAENLFPRRSFGLSGADAVNLEMSNVLGRNNYNQANYATETGQRQALYNQKTGQANADAQAESDQTGALISGGTAIASAAMLALLLTCVVARAAFGEESNDWRVFRHWLLTDAPKSFRKAYAQYGPAVAKVVNRSKLVKVTIQALFSIIINRRRHAWA